MGNITSAHLPTPSSTQPKATQEGANVRSAQEDMKSQNTLACSSNSNVCEAEMQSGDTTRATTGSLGPKRKRPAETGAQTQAQSQTQVQESWPAHVIGKECIRSWKVVACGECQQVLMEQLVNRARVEDEEWTTYHIAVEFDARILKDQGKNKFRLNSAAFQLGGGVGVLVLVKRDVVDDGFGCYVDIRGYHGDAKLTTTAFRFGRGEPMQETDTSECEADQGWGNGPFFKDEDLATGGWLEAHHTLPVLVTLQLKH